MMKGGGMGWGTLHLHCWRGGYVSGCFWRERGGGAGCGRGNLLVAIDPRRCGFVDRLNIKIRQSTSWRRVEALLD